MQREHTIRVVTLGGGTGSYTLLSGMKHIPHIDLTAIVAMTDNGGSTGVLRDELGVLPPGDARQCLIALSEESDMVRTLMSYRFTEGSLSGHNFGNIFLAGLEKVTGSFEEGVRVAGRILKTNGRVLPITNETATLHAVLSDGNVISGEDAINQSHFSDNLVEHLYVNEDATIHTQAEEAIIDAEYIVISPGNHYSSVLPNLIVPGAREAFRKSKARIIYIPNLTNKKGHTLGWSIRDYLHDIEKFLEKKVDIILVNSETPSKEQIEVYKLEEGDGVLVVNDVLEDKRTVARPLMSHALVKYGKSDAISDTRSFIRHDSQKLKKELEDIFSMHVK